MSQSAEDLAQKLIDNLDGCDLTTEETTTAIKNLKTFAEAKKLLDPDPIPDPEPTGAKAFFVRHSDALIKVAGTLAAITLIAGVETKGDVIFRTKASKYI